MLLKESVRINRNRLKKEIENVLTDSVSDFLDPEYYRVDIKDGKVDNSRYIDVYVYAELSLSEFTRFAERNLNKVVMKYDPDAYFEAQRPGIFVCRIWL